MRRLIYVCLVAAVALGCDARFTDLSDTNLTVGDAGLGGSAGSGEAGTGGAATGGSAGTGGTVAPVVVATGSFTGRGGYDASGTVDLIDDNGALRVEFSDDFSSARVPGPYVIVSVRDSLGSNIDENAGDLNLGMIQSIAGAQSYDLPRGVTAEDFDYVWVYCLPFTVETARAELVAVP